MSIRMSEVDQAGIDLITDEKCSSWALQREAENWPRVPYRMRLIECRQCNLKMVIGWVEMWNGCNKFRCTNRSDANRQRQSKFTHNRSLLTQPHIARTFYHLIGYTCTETNTPPTPQTPTTTTTRDTQFLHRTIFAHVKTERSVYRVYIRLCLFAPYIPYLVPFNISIVRQLRVRWVHHRTVVTRHQEMVVQCILWISETSTATVPIPATPCSRKASIHRHRPTATPATIQPTITPIRT